MVFEKDAGFGQVVYTFYSRLSELAFIGQPFDYLVDVFYAVLNPDRSDADEAYLEKMLHGNRSEYAMSFAKVKMISLLLYKMNLLPRPAIKGNMLHKEFLDIKQSGMYVGEKSIEFRTILNHHWVLCMVASSKGMEINVHIDLLWAYITPYVTEEDAYIWNGIAKQMERHGEAYGYTANIEKIELISRIMDRSGLQFPRSVMDDGTNEQWKPELS